MPSGDFLIAPHLGAGTDASGSATARDATDVAGTSNPDIDATGTAEATQVAQRLNLRRFVSRPLAATTFAGADGDWTFSFAAGQSNTNHAQLLHCRAYLWRPSTGARVGTTALNLSPVSANTTTTAETAATNPAAQKWSATQAILDGDIIVFEVGDEFTQSMSSAYTTFFSYDGTTEASTTTCASFVTPPAALTLFTAAATALPASRRVLQAVNRSSTY